MASRTGILSDKMMEKNCMDYKILPLGFANSEYSGGLSNPYLQGIKTSKYQMSAPKPASADISAVNRARLMVGNRQANARLMLDQYQKEAKEWVVPKVSASAMNRMYKDVARNVAGEIINQVVSILPRSSPGQTFGASITKETIGINSEPLKELQDRYIAHYGSLSPSAQKIIGAELIKQLNRDGIILKDYFLSAQILKGQATKKSSAKLPDRIQEIKRAIAAFHVRNSSVNLDNIFGVLPKNLVSSSLDTERDIEAGSSTEISIAETQQGVAQPKTTSTQPEIEKK
jgi:uncharacterized protein YfiM (DUF2279 family)